MKNINLIVLKNWACVIVLLLVGFNTFGQSRAERKAAKKDKAAQEYQMVKEVVNSGKIKIVIDRATSQKGFSRNLTDGTYALIINGERGETDLPFYGTAQNAGYNSDTGITFDGELLDYSVKFKDKKNRVNISFSAKSPNQESLRFNIALTGARASIAVNSTFKSSMSYNGFLSSYEN